MLEGGRGGGGGGTVFDSCPLVACFVGVRKPGQSAGGFGSPQGCNGFALVFDVHPCCAELASVCIVALFSAAPPDGDGVGCIRGCILHG